jgi:ATP-dependent RNA helicase MSS116
MLRITGPRLPMIATHEFHQSAKWRQEAAAEAQDQEFEANDGPVTQFKDLALRGLVHPNVINTITKQMKIQTMTDVQSRTINEALSGVDMYVILVQFVYNGLR